MMTPEEANGLLDGTVPGPWLCEKDGDEYEFVIGTEDFGIITEAGNGSDGRLIAAAPALAETIARMTWEYAVQVEDVDGGWRTLNDGWLGEHEARARRDGIPGTRARIVRRLVSHVEVVE